MIKADNVVTCLEFIKNDIKGKSFVSQIAQGKYQLDMRKYYALKVLRISVNVAFYLFISYLIFF
jgi:hypothetical protein